MNQITIESLLNLIKTYNPDAIPDVKRAYELANYLHKGQIRQSGEPYIIHPLNVAYTLAEMHADCDTLCAGLLHDTIEDTDIKKEQITELFNEDVAQLVDGVTKLSKMNFSSKQEQNHANTRKIITSITEDVRIIIIKLADRLHNMRTLEHKSPLKQEENAKETMDIFVPLAYYIGAYRIKSELEDLSLRYLNPSVYRILEAQKREIEEDSRKCLQEMLQELSQKLNDLNINHKIQVRIKNIYGIYKKIEKGYKIHDIYDLLSVKIIVEDKKDCYIALGVVHECYKWVPGRIKDYIGSPKTNMYQSLHTTVFGPYERLVQIQIRTSAMHKIASFGLTAFWDINKGEARYVMQRKLKNEFQFQFFKHLLETDKKVSDNKVFVNQVKKELLTDNVYAYTPSGNVVELPKGSTIIDYIYETDPENAHKMVDAFVNDEPVEYSYEIQNKDRIKIITSELSAGPKEEWEKAATTSYARRKIKEFNRKFGEI